MTAAERHTFTQSCIACGSLVLAYIWWPDFGAVVMLIAAGFSVGLATAVRGMSK